MDCARAIELLPWLFNGTLEAEERRALVEHLATCPQCVVELRDAALAGSIFSAHVASEDLVRYAFDEPWEGAEDEAARELLETHLEICPECAEQLDLVRQSRGDLEGKPSSEPLTAESLAKEAARAEQAARRLLESTGEGARVPDPDSRDDPKGR